MAANISLLSFATRPFADVEDPFFEDDLVQFILLINNTGNVAISTTNITNSLGLTFAPNLSGGFNSGDSNTNNVHDVGETFQYRANYFITPQDIEAGVIICNINVTSTGSDSSTVSKIAYTTKGDYPPIYAISGVQTAIPSTVGVGSSAIFISSFQNTGTAFFNDGVNLSSSIGIVTEILKPDGTNIGDIDSDGNFEVGETWQFLTSYNVTQSDIDNSGSVDGSADDFLTNTITVTALFSGESSGIAVTGVATASVFLDSSSPVDYKSFSLIPDANFRNTDQYLVIEPTSPNNINLHAGGQIDSSASNLIIGGINNNVSISDTSKTVTLNSNNRIGFKTSGDYTVSGRGEIFVDHGNNIAHNIYAGVGISSSGIATINFRDNIGSQFSTLKCFTQVRNNTGDTEAFDYIIVSNNSVAVGQTFNRVSSGINTLVSVGCTINNNIVNMTLQNISTGPVSFVSHVIGIRSTTNAPTF